MNTSNQHTPTGHPNPRPRHFKLNRATPAAILAALLPTNAVGPCRRGRFAAGLTLALTLLTAVSAQAGSATWNLSSGSAWLTTGNWDPNTSYPGVAGTGANSDVATFSTVAISGNALGINMNGLSGNSLSLGSIFWNMTAGSAATIGNSSTTANGTLQLNGASVNVGGTGGTINNLLVGIGDSASQNLTIQNANNSGNKTMGLTLNNSSGEIYVRSGRTLTISSILSGASGFTKTGAGQLTLSGVNSSLSGGILVKNGTVEGKTSTSSLGTGGVTLGGSGSTGATLIGGVDFSAVNVTVNPPDSGTCVIGANGVGSGMGIGGITLNNANVTVQTYASAVAGATTVKGNVTGTGNLILNNLNSGASPSGRVILQSGRVVNNIGTITSQGVGTTANQIDGTIGANVTGVIQNSPTANLVLTADNATAGYAGNTEINAGYLQLNASKAAGTGTIYLGDTTGSSSAELRLAASGTNPNNDLSVRTGSSGTKTLANRSTQSVTYSGDITANDDLTILAANTGGRLTVSGTACTIATGKTVSFRNTGTSGSIMIDSAIWGGDGKITYTSSTVMGFQITGAKTYTGGATLNAMSGTGILIPTTSSVGPANAPTSGPFGTGTLTIGDTQMRGGTTTDTTFGNPITFSGNPTFTTVASEKSLIFTGDASLGATRTLTVEVGSTVNTEFVEFSGEISGSGFGITKAGAGNLVLSGINTYDGNTTVSAGELIGKTAGSCANSAVTVASGAANGVQLAATDGQWTCGGLTYSAGNTYVDFDCTAIAPSTTMAPLKISGDLAVNSTVNVIVRRGSALTAGISYPLITWTGSGPANLSDFGTVTLPASMPGRLTLDTGTKTISVMADITVPNLAYTNAPGVGRKIALADMQAAGLASSQGSPSYTISLPSGTSAQGGSVTTDGSLIVYTPVGTPASDSFSYTVSDGTAAGTATVTITFGSVAGAQIDPALIGNDGFDHAQFTLRGIPNTSYHVQRATVLEPTPNWTNADAGVTTGADGSYLWTDTVTITDLGGTVYYRISYP